MITSLKRKPSNHEMEEEEMPGLQFKKKRMLNSNQIVERINVQQSIAPTKFTKRYPTRRQTLKQIDDEFEK